ncbi:PRC and DUF2382 domain-containing protein [soil metagenome]
MLDRDQVLESRGATLLDETGSKIGTIQEIYLDQETDEPEWVLAKNGWGGKGSFVPLAQASMQGSDITVPYDKSQVKSSPGIDPDGELSQQEEAELYRHYGLEYSEQSSDSGLPEGRTDTDPADRDRAEGYDTSGPTTDDAMTRSEEELHIGKSQKEAGRVRLKKYVVTENVTQTVPVEREEVRVEREPITDSNVDQATSGSDITEEEHEVVLHEEEVVTEKRVVPKERVQLSKDTVTAEQQVSEEVRKEQIEEPDTKS